MKTKVKIAGQISSNFALLKKLPYYSGQKKDGMFNSFIITYDTKSAAQDALKHLSKRLREDNMKHAVIKQINCKNIHLILGNHDHHIEHNKILPNCFYKTYVGQELIEDKTLYDVKSRHLFSSVQHSKAVTIGKNKFFLSHFAHRVWDKSHRGIIHLYGHSHASIDDNWGKSMDVGIDNAYKLLGEYRPFYLNEVLDIMDKREIKILDHHDHNTNN